MENNNNEILLYFTLWQTEVPKRNKRKIKSTAMNEIPACTKWRLWWKKKACVSGVGICKTHGITHIRLSRMWIIIVDMDTNSMYVWQ